MHYAAGKLWPRLETRLFDLQVQITISFIPNEEFSLTMRRMAFTYTAFVACVMYNSVDFVLHILYHLVAKLIIWTA